MMPPDPTCTTDEYLAFERANEYWHELIDGRIRPRARSSIDHSWISGNILVAVGTRLRHTPYELLRLIRVKVVETGTYVYPDLSAFRYPAQVEDEHQDTVVDPCVLFEIYSDETEAFDRGERFDHYRQIRSLREYILVAQNEVRVERYVRDGEAWTCGEISELAGVLRIDTLGCELPLSEIYDEVEFSTDGL